MTSSIENPRNLGIAGQSESTEEDVMRREVLADANDLLKERKEKETDIDYAAEAIRLVITFEEYKRSSHKIFSRLGSDLREQNEKKLKEVSERLDIKYGQKERLSLAEALEMPEFKGERERLRTMFQSLLEQARRVAESRERIIADQRIYRDTNDAVLRTFMHPSPEINKYLNNEPLRETKMSFPVDPDLYLDEVSEEEYRRGKDMPPADRTILEIFDSIEEDLKNVPADFKEKKES